MQCFWMLCAVGGGSEAVTELLLVVHSFSHGTEARNLGDQLVDCQGCFVHANAAQAAKCASTCVLGYTHLWF